VLVLSAMDVPGVEKWGIDLSTQVAALRAHGSLVEVIRTDAASVAAAGTNPLDPSTRTPAARAGLAQGRAEAARIKALWS
jgi:NTE family protein